MYKLTQSLLKGAVALLIIMLIITGAAGICYGLFPAKYINYIEESCRQYGVDKYLVLSLIKAESNFKENAHSTADAKGLMQLTDDTFAHCMNILGESKHSEDILDPKTNIEAGVWYLSYLLDRYNGNITNAVAAYNAGATNVDKWLQNPDCSTDQKTLKAIPFGETQRHCEKINAYMKIYRLLY